MLTLLRQATVSFILVAVTLPVFGGKPKGAPLTKLPTDSIELKNLRIPKPKQPCPNWAWAAVVQMMLDRQNVTTDQEDWIVKAYGGEVCIETAPVLDDIRRIVTENRVQPDGSKVHLEGVVTKDISDIGYLVGTLREQKPLLILFGGRVLVLKSMDYDEYIYPNNQRMFVILKMTMADPLGGEPVIFDAATDDATQIQGAFEVRVGPIQPFQ